MTVEELIIILKTKDKDATVETWCPYYDDRTKDIYISDLDKKSVVMITNSQF